MNNKSSETNKRIGVITFSKSINYGAFLQAYALQEILNKKGYDSSLIDYENINDRKRYSIIKTHSLKGFIASVITMPFNIKRKYSFKKCIKYLKYSSISDSYDVAIAGSDQIWNPDLFGGKIDERYFLRGIAASRKIAYAASVTDKKIISDFRDVFSQYLGEFDYISVREADVRKILERTTGKDIFVALDPTLLLTSDEWMKTISQYKEDDNDYIFSYFVGKTTKRERDVLARVSDMLKMKCVSYSVLPLEKNIYKHAYTDSPFRFLSRIRDSKLVLTSSFHGIVLAIMLKKNFYYFLPRENRRSRIDNILKMLGLTDRIIETEADLDKVSLDNIDYTMPQKKLSLLRDASLKWLDEAIEN